MIKLKTLLSELVRLNSIKEVEAIKGELAAAAQEVYDNWTQDVDGMDDELGSGGICDGIADGMIDVLIRHGIHNVQTQYNEPHTYVIGRFREGIFTIDVPYSTYESGYLYTWKKKPEVRFDPSFIDIQLLDANPRKLKQYIDSM